MGTFFQDLFCRLTSFLLCAQMLVHLRPKASYEKYIRLLASIMGLILFLEPFRAIFDKVVDGKGVPEAALFEAVSESSLFPGSEEGQTGEGRGAEPFRTESSPEDKSQNADSQTPSFDVRIGEIRVSLVEPVRVNPPGESEELGSDPE